MSALLNHKDLLKPISNEMQSGLDLRFDVSPTSLYYKIKDARTRARNIERKAQLGEDDLDPTSDWRIVYETAIDILSSYSKDLEIATWLLESLIRRYSFAGLYEGFLLLHELIERYWDSIYPSLDESDLEIRLAPLTGLNGEDADGTLIQPIVEQPITEGNSVGPFVLWEYQQALEMEKISDPKALEKKLEQGCVKLEDIKKAVSESSQKFYSDLWKSLTLCIDEYQALTTLLEEKCAKDAPPSSTIRQSLEVFQDHIKFILKDSPFSVNDGAAYTELNEEENSNKVDSMNSANGVLFGKITTRQEALIQLVKVADFFKQTEPHSPIPYLLDRAVRWGNLPFPELLQEMISDEGARKSAFELSGILKT